MMTHIRTIQDRVVHAAESRVAVFAVPPLRRALILGLFVSLIALTVAYCGLLFATVVAATDRQALERSLPKEHAIVGESEGEMLALASHIDRALAEKLGFTEAPEAYVLRASVEKDLSLRHAF